MTNSLAKDLGYDSVFDLLAKISSEGFDYWLENYAGIPPKISEHHEVFDNYYTAVEELKEHMISALKLEDEYELFDLERYCLRMESEGKDPEKY